MKEFHSNFTIRITTKCTQTCSHCCFSCSPEMDDHMSIETSEKISRFLKSNQIKMINAMGGEFFCNPNWKSILSNLIQSVELTRIVTNGDWSENNSDEVGEFLSEFNTILIAISNDKFHQKKYIKSAVETLTKYKINYVLGDFDNSAIIPIGRGELHGGIGTMFEWCKSDAKCTDGMIDENGVIYYCSMGIWPYDNIYNFENGNFIERWKEIHDVFTKSFIGSCSRCYQSYQLTGKKPDYFK